jgi:trigger factor
LEYTVSTENNWQTVVTVSVDAGEIQPKLDESFKQYQQNVKLEGFRKGKVPRQLVKKMYGKSIESEVFEPYFTEAWKKVFEEKDYHVINSPQITDTKFDPKKGLNFKIIFDVRPEIEDLKYEGISVEKKSYEVTEKDVEDNLKALQDQHAMIYTVDGVAEMGHILVADLQELDRTGVPVIGKKYESQQVWLGNENKYLADQLVGIKAGEERNITLMPKNANDPSVVESSDIPKEQKFQVTVKEVKERKLPDLDDEFAKDLGEYESIAELRNKLEESLKARAQSEGKTLFQNALTDELIKSNDFEIPQSMLDNYLDSMVSDAKKSSQDKKIDEKQIKEYYKVSAIRNIKWYLLRDKMVETEELSVSDEELEERIKAIEGSENGEEQAKEIRESDDRKKGLKEQILEDKVFEFLISKADVKEVIMPWRVEPEKDLPKS